MKRLWIAMAMLAPVSVSAQTAPAEEPMTLGQFLAQWDEAQKAGVMARMSPDTHAAMRAIQRGTMRYRVLVETDKELGRPPRSCPPPLGTGKLNTNDIIPKLKALPAADHAKPFEEALIPILHSLYPCPAP